MARILLVEDDRALFESLRSLFLRYGHEVTGVEDFKDVEGAFLAASPELVVLDINLPYFDGFHLVRTFRRSSRAPIIILSARGGDAEQVLGMELGADDYIVKPFSREVLLAKINGALRRTYGEYAEAPAPVTKIGVLELDNNSFRVGCRGETVELTKNEYRLLRKLAEASGGLVKREELFEELWDETAFVDENTLTVNVTRAKARLAELGLIDVIKTRRGLGYYLDLTALGE